MIPTKAFFITLSLSAVVVFAATTSMRTVNATPDQPQWKNLKVLPQNISKDDLDKVMDQWKAALGVKCGFCHARDAQSNKMDFASDAKPEKDMAREMMKMTDKINEKFFSADADANGAGKKDNMPAVTCYTCHHGAPHPEAAAGMGEEHDHDHDHGQQPGNTPPPPPSN